MKKIFITLILMLSVFSIANAHPFKSEKELDNFFSQIDKRIKEELKKNYREEYSKRKISANNEYSFEIEDDGSSFFTRNIDMKPKTEITQYFNKKGELYMISSLTSETEGDLYALYRKYDKNGNLSIYTYAIDGKNTDKGYYSDGKLAYIKELKILKGEAPIPNGKYIEYYKNGQIKVQGHYKNGKREGEFKTFLRNSKNAGSVIYKDGKIIKSTLIKSMKDNASFSPISYVNYDLDTSYSIGKVDFPNKLLKTYYMYNKKGVLNGDSIKYYEEGNIQSIVPYKNNLVEGLIIRYYENGNIKEEVNYKNDKMNGEAKSYDENGKLNGRTLFKDDIKLEEEVHKENEILKNTFKNGEVVKQDICSLNGNVKERRVLNGNEMEYSSFYENGNVKQKILTKDKVIIKEQLYARNGNIMLNSFLSTDGKPIKEVFEYYPDGKLFRKITSINEMLDGDYLEYYANGNLKNKAFFKNDKQEGEYIAYYKNGAIMQKVLYKNGVRNGEAIAYYENGVIEQKAYFVNGKKEKEHLYYDKNGNLTKTEIYKNGIKQ